MRLFFQHELVEHTRSENSFASKLSLNLLLRAFPTLDSSFVRNTFKSQNFSYYVRYFSKFYSHNLLLEWNVLMFMFDLLGYKKSFKSVWKRNFC